MASAKPHLNLILASTSPFRRALLASTGLKFDVARPEVDESTLTAKTPAAVAKLRAEAKGMAGAEKAKGPALVIGADQVLSLKGKAFDKVETAAEAKDRLMSMAGQTHYLHAAYCLIKVEGEAAPRLVHSEVIDIPMPMRKVTEAEVDAYVATGEWQGSVGCYQFENRGVALFDGVNADHSAIVGLPLQPLLAALRAQGLNSLFYCKD